MSTPAENSYSAIAELNLWFKLRSGESLTLTDFPELIPLRWQYFRDQWEFIRQDYFDKVNNYQNPDLLRDNIRLFSLFVESQRTFSKSQNPFNNTNILFQFFGIFDTTLITAIPVSPEEQKTIDDKIKRINRFTRDDFVNLKNKLRVARDAYADIRGLSDDDYNRTYNRGSIAQQTGVTNKDMNQLLEINNAIKSIDFILANQFALSTNFIDPFALARQNADNPEVNIGQYEAGQLIKMGYNQDLRALAQEYLGDEQKWIDIAIANGLKPPYIDEIGQKVPLIANGSGNKVVISETDLDGKLNIDKLFVNQVIFVQSDTQRFPDQRTIISIEQVPISGDILIELNGEEDLTKYKINEGAHIRVFKPNTINSNFYVLIPTNRPVADTRKELTPWFLRTKGEDLKRIKVDLELDEKNDLRFATSGDLGLAYGLANAMQALKLKFGIAPGELRRHTNFGLVSVMGRTNNDIQAIQQSLADSIAELVSADDRFDRIESLEIEYLAQGSDSPVGFKIGLMVRLAGVDQVIPISFTVQI